MILMIIGPPVMVGGNMKISTASQYLADTDKLETEIKILKEILRQKEFELEAVEYQASVAPETIRGY